MSGLVHRLRVPVGEHLRFDSGYDGGSTVSTFYDAMLGKVIAWAPTRGEAARVLADALARAEIHGVVTNRDLLVNTLRHPEFLRGQTDTGFLERHDPAQLGAPAIDAAVHQVHALAVALAPAVHVPSPQPAGIPRGWRNVGLSIATSEFAHGREHITIALERSRAAVRAAINGEAFVDLTVVSSSPELVEFELLGVRYRVSLQRVGRHVYADSARGSSALIQAERFPLPDAHAAPGSLVSPMPGTVVAVPATVGQHVRKGEMLVALEAMKMEHAIRSPHDGEVTEVCVKVGTQVETDQVLVVVTEAAAADEARHEGEA